MLITTTSQKGRNLTLTSLDLTANIADQIFGLLGRAILDGQRDI
jgi:hypothetical protein